VHDEAAAAEELAAIVFAVVVLVSVDKIGEHVKDGRVAFR
jgi:hypothetical protein